jgi:hypothetical protein
MPIRLISMLDLISIKGVTKFITNTVIKLVKPKVAPKLKLWFNKPDSDAA